jgi:hypothetical protein
MSIDVTFLRDWGQQPGQAERVAGLLADFLAAAVLAAAQGQFASNGRGVGDRPVGANLP